jgi:hypothetical protein
MAIRITGATMTPEAGDRVVAGETDYASRDG